MKINGMVINSAYEEVVVIPRHTGNIVFKARAISNFEPFEKLCPTPKPPLRQFPGGRTIEDVENPDFQKAFNNWAESKVHWMFLESLKATHGLAWETVDMADSTTWSNYQKELSAAGFSPAEQARIIQCVSQANGLDQSKIDEATESFLADQAALASTQSSPASAPSATPSGEPASVSA